ncbi:K(+)-transporting ATPase subunit C [Chitinophaga sp. GCM10012297]|uniref:Potassium-transporting ATPase KdpC subunit n=1 Tax=Chitinophaga chungangae TaxID=2821488 RepID=A0ABS3YEE2_9BACT|nr:K(+)-transporting ATPase subunit C [Chitinophaga chungangae]MBO9153046.1 K(+)-transporting ATPase subunit C [Chitinophaga chungangae]
MKKYFFPALKLTVVMVLLTAGIYPLLIAGISKLAPGKGDGVTVTNKGKVVGYANVGQQFTDDKYFQGRPSAVGYNAAGSGGSNKGPSNGDYLKVVQERIDTFLAHNPGVKKENIPAELVTASGSGLDPHLSPAAALLQVPRIAKLRNLPENKLNELVKENTKGPLLGMFGPSTVNVLRLNIALDNL